MSTTSRTTTIVPQRYVSWPQQRPQWTAQATTAMLTNHDSLVRARANFPKHEQTSESERYIIWLSIDESTSCLVKSFADYLVVMWLLGGLVVSSSVCSGALLWSSVGWLWWDLGCIVLAPQDVLVFLCAYSFRTGFLQKLYPIADSAKMYETWEKNAIPFFLSLPAEPDFGFSRRQYNK